MSIVTSVILVLSKDLVLVLYSFHGKDLVLCSFSFSQIQTWLVSLLLAGSSISDASVPVSFVAD